MYRYFKILVFEENAFVTKSRANAFTHSLKKRMAAAATVAKSGSGATVRIIIYLFIKFLFLFIIRSRNVVLSVITLK